MGCRIHAELCINYCNEVLQQQFNRFVFKAEQAEYEYEGIEWSNIEFADNQVALDLIDDRRTGIFSILDEQCRLPKCTDITFVRAIYDKCEKNTYFSASQMQKSKVRKTHKFTELSMFNFFLMTKIVLPIGDFRHISLCWTS